MQRHIFPKRVSDITDRDFWTSLRVPKNRSDTASLKEAIRLGLKGDSPSAWRMLAAYHRHSLGKEWQALRGAHLKSPPPDPAVLQDLLNHKITCWHTQVVQFDKKIDWVPATLPGDCLSGFNYFHWFRPAVTAFIQTGEPRHREFILDIMTQYYDAREHPLWHDVIKHWVFCFLGVHAKWQTMLTSYLALIHSGEVPEHTLEGFLKTFMGFGRAVDQKLGDYIPAYNALAVAMTSLLHIARVFPEFRESAGWDRKATRMVLEHARKGFFEDGGNRERVWGYGTMHLGSLTQAYEAGLRSGGLGRHDREILATIRRACQWYAKTAGPFPHCWFPTYGDAGWGSNDQLTPIRKMAHFLPEAADESFGVDRARSYLLKPSGFAILRNGNEPDSTHLSVNFGRFAGWHSHWDLLSMNLWSQGEALLEEQCRFGPYSNPLDTLFRAPESHNLMLIDGMIYDCREVAGQDVAWFSNDTVDYFSATHRAYRYFVYGREGLNVSPNIEALVRRTILFVKNPGYVVVMDSARDLNSETFNRAISQYWHSPFPFQPLGRDRARTQGEKACLLVHTQPESLHRLDASVDFAGAEVAHLGHAYERHCLRARRWMPLGHKGIMGFTTILYPFTGGLPQISVKPLATEGGAAWVTEALQISTPVGEDVIMLNPEKRKGFVCNGQKITGRGSVRLGDHRGELIIR